MSQWKYSQFRSMKFYNFQLGYISITRVSILFVNIFLTTFLKHPKYIVGNPPAPTPFKVNPKVFKFLHFNRETSLLSSSAKVKFLGYLVAKRITSKSVYFSIQVDDV